MSSSETEKPKRRSQDEKNIPSASDTDTPTTSAGSDEEKPVSDSDPNDPNKSFGVAPDGGPTAWLAAAGGFSLVFCCLGFANSFGIFQQYYLADMLEGESEDKVAWIGSLPVFLQFATGMIGGPLFDRFGAKLVASSPTLPNRQRRLGKNARTDSETHTLPRSQVIRPAAVLYIALVMILSVCTKYWHFMLVQGVLMGVAMGLLQFPAFAAVLQHFDKKRGVAMGVVISGSSVGGIVVPIALSKLLNDSDLGFGWSVRIIGFVMLPFIAFSLVTVKGRLPPRKSNFLILGAFRERLFLLLVSSLFFAFIGMFTPIFFIPTYAVYRGMGAALAGYQSAILNASSTFGRIIPGILADKYGKLNVFSAGCIATGIVTFCMNEAGSNAAIIVYSVVFGFTSGSIISGATAALSLCPKDPRDLGTYMGMGLFVASFGGLMGPPVSGAMVHRYGGFLELAMFSGAITLFGGVLGFITKMATKEGLFGQV
ncbi:uncharacterized protein MKZ38_002678 [Zalerion maritima]|uniref:Major facilitator superfamily (MFS) profile domain-containing protein n=1 Tax=Zalerion maritima TaxID=339359 RepID=A0AAD5RPH2_9PEZI|nr:uncharacterized protein MKZ38_002678 [Zalerion maritima]